ncbi:MAG: DUF3048 domain-containing protein [Clostridia bacterium]|nr:DUF3048 domain-containing protein [Clostridia bacterium]
MNKQKFLKLIAVLAVVTLIATLFAACSGKDEEDVTTTTELVTETTTEPEPTDVNPLTGLRGFPEAAQGKRPVAIVVENHPQARPQWGLCDPDIVIEGLAEGGITRMMYVFADVNAANKVGPTRSARNNYVEMAQALDAVYVHFGGSYAAYNLMKTDTSIDHIDGSYDGKYFKRDKSRGVATEHTAYTTGEWVAQAIADKGFRTDVKEDYAKPFNFAKQTRTLQNQCESVRVVFSNNYTHTFQYDDTDGLFYNIMNTTPMKDSDGNQMKVTNVIVIYCNVTALGGDAKLVDWNLNEGKGLYFTNGGYEEITWKKGGVHDMLKLYSSDGSELQLNPGKSWIGFVPQANSASTEIA